MKAGVLKLQLADLADQRAALCMLGECCPSSCDWVCYRPSSMLEVRWNVEGMWSGGERFVCCDALAGSGGSAGSCTPDGSRFVRHPKICNLQSSQAISSSDPESCSFCSFFSGYKLFRRLCQKRRKRRAKTAAGVTGFPTVGQDSEMRWKEAVCAPSRHRLQ